MVHETSNPSLTLQQIDSENWREITKLEVSPEQREYIVEPSYYLAMCAYGGIWHPLAIKLGNEVIGFMMWAYDHDEDSCWLGGFYIDRRHQRNGYGREALNLAIEYLVKEKGYQKFALSYKPTNLAAKALYTSFGFSETGELAEDELVARMLFLS